MSRFERVHLLEGRELRRKASMTFLRHYDGCPRAGFLYQAHKGVTQTDAMVRGSALHLVLERACSLMVEQDEPTVPPEVVTMLLEETLGDLPVPLREHDYMRESAYRWATGFTCDPRSVIAVERLIALDIDGWEVRCKVDFAESTAQGMVVRVLDWKSSRAAPSFDDVARKRPDGTLSAKNFQLVLYALALAHGYPVRETVLECDACGGNGFHGGDAGDSLACALCHGRGTVREEVREPFPLAAHAERFDLEFVYPGIEDREGRMVTRPVSLNRLELAEYMESLRGLLKRLERSEETGEWDAILSDAACGECPARAACPIPDELHDHAGVINTLEEAAEASEVLERRDALQKALRKEIKAFANGQGGVEIRYGKDKAWRFVYSESDRIDDRDGMFDAVERAISYGEPFERARFVKTHGSELFKAVRLTEEELAAEVNPDA